MASRGKEPTAFRTISEASEELGVAQHVLRHWEDVFSPVRPMRRAGGRRLYRVQDIELLRGIKSLLHDQGYTTKGVQKILKSEGVEKVSAMGRGEAPPATRNSAGGLDAATLISDIEAILSDLRGLKQGLTQLGPQHH